MWLAERLISIVAPHDCLGCGAEGTLACQACSQHIQVLPSRCYRCGTPTYAHRVCGNCSQKSVFNQVWVYTIYKDLPKKLVQSLKFSRTIAGAELIADRLQEILSAFATQACIVVYVPTTNQRRRQRGYDQAELIAKRLARSLGCQQRGLLVRLGSTRQVGAKRATRLQQLAGAFDVQDTSLARDTPLLLVDDVITTGATLEEAARTLRRAGFTNISAAVFAQA